MLKYATFLIFKHDITIRKADSPAVDPLFSEGNGCPLSPLFYSQTFPVAWWILTRAPFLTSNPICWPPSSQISHVIMLSVTFVNEVTDVLCAAISKAVFQSGSPLTGPPSHHWTLVNDHLLLHMFFGLLEL